MDLNKDIQRMSNEVIKLANENNMGVKGIEWLLEEIERTILEKATLNTIF